MKNCFRFLLVLAIIIITSLITWKITMLNINIAVNEDTAYITSFGQTHEYDFMPLW